MNKKFDTNINFSILHTNCYHSSVKRIGRITLTTAATLLLSIGYTNAADTATGAGAGVSYGTGSSTNADTSVAIGKKAQSQTASAIAIGNESRVEGIAVLDWETAHVLLLTVIH